MSTAPENYLIDPDLIKQAYLKAFEGIEFPDNFRSFEETPIESRAPGSAITARIWNDTINELRNICRALAMWMREYEEGIEAALDEFTKKINDVLQHLLDVDQREFVEWLMNASFSVSFDEPDDNSCYLVFTITDGETPITVRSGNLKSNQIFWMYPDEPEPLDADNNPIWRIKLNTSDDAIPDSLATIGYVDNAIDDALADYALKSEVGTKAPLDPLEADTVWGGIEEVYNKLVDEYALKDAVGSKSIGSPIEADDVWGAVEEVYSNAALDPITKQTLITLAGDAENLLALERTVGRLDEAMSTAEGNINKLKTRTKNTKDTSNADFRAFRNAIVEMQAALLTGTADTSTGNGKIWVVDKSNTGWWNRTQITTSNDFSFANGNYNQCLNTASGKSSITATLRGGWCHLKMNLYVNATDYAVDNAFVVPILALPVWARPYVSSYDIPCTTHTDGSYSAQVRIVTPANKTYSTPIGSRTFSVPTIVLNRFKNGAGERIKIPAANTFVKAEVSYPLLYVCSAGAASSTAVFSAPSVSLINFNDDMDD